MADRPEAPRQLALDLPVDSPMEAEDFLVGASNEAAYAALEAWPNWPDRVLVLTGPEASGKSHLAAIWAARAHAWTLQRAALRDEDVPRLVSAGALVVEDCDRATGHEPALFHLLNLARERGTFVLLTARSGVDAWAIATPDLASRLRLAPSVVVGPTDDGLLRAVLVKLFVERQLVVDTSLVDYLALRLDRSIAAARDAVERLDRAGLERGRRITRALAGEVLRDLDIVAPEP